MHKEEEMARSNLEKDIHHMYYQQQAYPSDAQFSCSDKTDASGLCKGCWYRADTSRIHGGVTEAVGVQKAEQCL